MYAVHREVNVVEQLVVVLDAHAGGEEDHHLLLAVLLQEGEQEEEPLVGRAHHVALFGINKKINIDIAKTQIPHVSRLCKQIWQMQICKIWNFFLTCSSPDTVAAPASAADRSSMPT